jgi:nitroreductase
MSTNLAFTGKKCSQTLEYLQKRRSCPLKMMGNIGPTKDEISNILESAARTPDHGKLFPWYFMIFQGDSRKNAGEILRKAWLADNPDTPKAKLDLEAERFMRAPLVISVISRIKRGKHPQWEQILSAGAVCQNLCLAANAMGYGTNWLTEWYSYNDIVRQELGLDQHDNIAGFIYIGKPTDTPEERPRPDIAEITTFWDALDTPLKKGEIYDKENFDYPAE